MTDTDPATPGLVGWAVAFAILLVAIPAFALGEVLRGPEVRTRFGGVTAKPQELAANPTAPTEIAIDESLLDEDTPEVGHYPCEEGGPDEPLHSVCGAFIRGLPASAKDELCSVCDALLILAGIVTCRDHWNGGGPGGWTS